MLKLFLIPLIIITDGSLLTGCLWLMSQASDIALFSGIIATSALIFLNYLLIKQITK